MSLLGIDLAIAFGEKAEKAGNLDEALKTYKTGLACLCDSAGHAPTGWTKSIADRHVALMARIEKIKSKEDDAKSNTAATSTDVVATNTDTKIAIVSVLPQVPSVSPSGLLDTKDLELKTKEGQENDRKLQDDLQTLFVKEDWININTSEYVISVCDHKYQDEWISCNYGVADVFVIKSNGDDITLNLIMSRWRDNYEGVFTFEVKFGDMKTYESLKSVVMDEIDRTDDEELERLVAKRKRDRGGCSCSDDVCYHTPPQSYSSDYD